MPVKNLLTCVKAMAAEVSSAVCFLSFGKDSLVMLDLIQKHAKNIDMTYVYLYYFKGLSFRESLIAYYEKRYSIKVLQLPSNDIIGAQTGQKGKRRDADNMVRKLYNKRMLFYGYRMDESLERRAQMTKLENGIDYVHGYCFPLKDWNKSHVVKHVSKEKLKLPIEYRHGFRDINTLKGDALVWLKSNFPKDYELVKKQYPKIEADLIKAQAEYE